MPILQNVPCQPTSSSIKPMKGARIAVPTPPAAHRIPVPKPKRRLNHPLIDAISGTMEML